MEHYKNSCVICQDNKTLFELFHEETSLSNNKKQNFDLTIHRAFDNLEFMNEIYGKRTVIEPQENNIVLTKNSNSDSDLLSSIVNRYSSKEFNETPIPLDKLSNILLYSYGRSVNNNYTTPSAGGTYPIKLILIINKVVGLKPGMYEYCVQSNSLSPLILEKVIDYENITSNSRIGSLSAFSIHFIAHPNLICYKYQDRGYRFLNLECGHIAQNLSLVSTKYDIKSICSGGFLDKEFIDYLNKNSEYRFKNHLNIYEMFFGN